MSLTSRYGLMCSGVFLLAACGGSDSGSGPGEVGSPTQGGSAQAGSSGAATAAGGAPSSAGANALAGASSAGASTGGPGGSPSFAGAPNGGGVSSGGASGGAGSSCAGPIGTLSGALATGINFLDTDGQRVDAHGGGIIKVGDTFYLHGEYFSPTTTDNDFNGFSMYSSKDLATWKNEGIILPQQASGELGPKRKGDALTSSSARARVSSCCTRTPRPKTIRPTKRSCTRRRRP